MKVIIQRVCSAAVTVDGTTVGEIQKGFLALVGIGKEDDEAVVQKMADKIYKLRIFEDENGKTNLSAAQVDAELLAVSQFTLYADCSHGNRPGFAEAAPPDMANHLFEVFKAYASTLFTKVESGVFGADMQVSLVNDGPFTVVIEM